MRLNYHAASVKAIVAVATVALAAWTGSASAAISNQYTIGSPPPSLAALVGTGNSILVGDKIFDNFTYTTTGDDMPAAADVNITPEIMTVNSQTMWGFQISGAFQDLNTPGQSIANIGYSVHVVDPSLYLITGAALNGDTDVIGAGEVQVTEQWTPELGPAQLRVYDIEPGNGVKLTDQIQFDDPVSSLTVTKQILASIDDGSETSGASVTSIDQLYTQTPTGGGGVPEPASLGILVLGATGLLTRRRRR